MEGGAAGARRPLRKQLLGLPVFARELIAGGLAGGLAKTCVAPLERAKIIYQTRGGSMAVTGMLQQIWQQEGVPGLFRGNAASVLRIVPYAAIHFGSYEYFRRAIVGLVHQQHGSGSIIISSSDVSHPLWDLLAGSASGATAVVATYPLDLVRTRLAWATEAPAAAAAGAAAATQPHHGIWSELVATVQQDGFAGLYRGVTPTLVGILPYAGLKFYAYQAMKNRYRRWTAWKQHQAQQQAAPHALAQPSGSQVQAQQPQQQQPVPIHVTLLFGGVAGLIAQTLTYPLDVIRRRMQVAQLAVQPPPQPQQAAAGAGPTPLGSAALASSSSSSSSSAAGLARGQSSSRCSAGVPAAQPLVAVAGAQQQGSAAVSCTAAGWPSAASAAPAQQPRHGLRCIHGWSLPPGLPHRQTMLAVTRQLLAEGGTGALFRGLSINYIKVVPSTAIGFTVYDALKSYLGLSGGL